MTVWIIFSVVLFVSELAIIRVSAENEIQSLRSKRQYYSVPVPHASRPSYDDSYSCNPIDLACPPLPDIAPCWPYDAPEPCPTQPACPNKTCTFDKCRVCKDCNCKKCTKCTDCVCDNSLIIKCLKKLISGETPAPTPSAGPIEHVPVRLRREVDTFQDSNSEVLPTQNLTQKGQFALKWLRTKPDLSEESCNGNHMVIKGQVYCIVNNPTDETAESGTLSTMLLWSPS